MSSSKSVGMLLVAIVVVIVAYSFLTMPDQRSGTQKLGDAIHDLDKGPDKAARQLEDRTPGQKLGDAVKDAGDNVKKNTANP
jgi:hypothetical protein